jgi:hypothetical protein
MGSLALVRIDRRQVISDFMRREVYSFSERHIDKPSARSAYLAVNMTGLMAMFLVKNILKNSSCNTLRNAEMDPSTGTGTHFPRQTSSFEPL